VFFENPRKPSSTALGVKHGPHDSITDIERMYGQRKAIAKRTPLFPSRRKSTPLPSCNETASSSTITSVVATPPVEADLADILSTPVATEGETATETDFETEVEIDDDTPVADIVSHKISKHQPQHSIASSMSSSGGADGAPRYRKKAVSQHDLLNKYFRRDAVVIRNIDLLR
jgi:phosphatidylethanolamine N-methyltransferase